MGHINDKLIVNVVFDFSANVSFSQIISPLTALILALSRFVISMATYRSDNKKPLVLNQFPACIF